MGLVKIIGKFNHSKQGKIRPFNKDVKPEEKVKNHYVGFVFFSGEESKEKIAYKAKCLNEIYCYISNLGEDINYFLTYSGRSKN